MKKYYVFIQNGKINGCGMCPCSGDNLFSMEVPEEIYNNITEFGNEYYTYDTGEIKLNPEYESLKIKETKQERIEQIKQELINIDAATIRPLRAGEQDVLDELEARAEVLRQELAELEAQITKNTEDEEKLPMEEEMGGLPLDD